MQPRLEWFETFLAIAEHQSFTGAGERLARSQSAVSLQLRQLEALTGRALFERDTRHVRLTAAGERMIPAAHRALEAAQAALRTSADAGRRLLKVGVPEEYVDRLVPALVQHTRGEDPGVAFEVECAPSAELEARLNARDIALAFVLADEVRAEGELVATDPIRWLQASGSTVSTERPLPVALFDRDCSWRNRALKALDNAGIDYRIAVTSSSVAGVRAGIRAGIAVGALAESTAGPALEDLVGPSAPPPLGRSRLVMLGDVPDDAHLAAALARVRRLLTSNRSACE
ncbi:MAG: LysR family transcriptional regulator [Pseudomonadota bacterium]